MKNIRKKHSLIKSILFVTVFSLLFPALLFSCVSDNPIQQTDESSSQEDTPPDAPDTTIGEDDDDESIVNIEKLSVDGIDALSPEAADKLLNDKAENMRQRVINAPKYKHEGEGRVIYVSNDGNDDNDGLSKQTPICTIVKLNGMLKRGDTVLFRCGDHFRGNIVEVFADNTFASYGSGMKPIINSSAKNYADPALWSETDVPNVYKLSTKLSNVGIIHFDPSYTSYGEYNELYGKMRIPENDDHKYGNISEDLEFYSDRAARTLYLYSASGNPGQRFSDIEIGSDKHTFTIGRAKNVTIDGLWIMHTGSHGVGASYGNNLTVKNCVFSWLGGSKLGNDNYTRYGNAVEVFGGCDGFTVENNWIYQIYDTGITHQYNSTGSCEHKNITYRENLIEYCFWSIEFYNIGDDGKRSESDILITENYCRYGGGWGSATRTYGSTLLQDVQLCPDVKNFKIEKNIFYRPSNNMVLTQELERSGKIEFSENIYAAEKGTAFGPLAYVYYPFDDTVMDTLTNHLNEKEPHIVFLPKAAE